MVNFSGTTQLNVIKLTYVWSIVNFSFLSTRRQNYIRSNPFYDANDQYIKWYLHLYPHGDGKEGSVYLFLLLELDKTVNAVVNVKIICDLLTDKKEKFKTFVLHRDFNRNEEAWGWEIINRKILYDNAKRLLPKDTLTFTCDVSYHGNVTKKESSPKAIVPHIVPASAAPCKLPEPPKALFEDHLLSDVVLINRGKEFHAHKAILAARSPIFQGMFLNKPGEKLYRVEIPDLKTEVVTEMLRFIYTNQVKNMKGLVLDLLVAADAYRLEDLKIMCAQELFKSITVQDAPDVLIIADKFRSDYLKDKLKAFMTTNAPQVVNTKQYKTLAESHPELADWALGKNINVNQNKNVVFGQTAISDN